MKHETCLVPGHRIPVPADLRGKRQALFFLLAQSQPVPEEIPDPLDSLRRSQSAGQCARRGPDSTPAPERLSAILGSDDFQFTF